MQPAKKNIQGYRFEGGKSESFEAQVVTEISVTLTVNGENWLALQCTPLELDALAVGFLFNEGVIRSKDEIASVRVCSTGDNVDVWLTHAVEKPVEWRRTSGCAGGATSVPAEAPVGAGSVGAGSVGAGSVGAGSVRAGSVRAGSEPAPTDGMRLRPEEITGLVTRLFEAQDLYRSTGGVHTSALSDGKRMLITSEDIGRHNTLDKIAGRCLLDGINPLRRVLITTGRISSEMIQKAARMGVAMVISRTAPSSLSIEMAEQAGVTLIGYARRDQFTVYSHPERVRTGPDGRADRIE